MTVVDLPVLPLVRVTLLAENTATGRSILGEHGLCWLIEAGDRRILFDLGQGLALARNAATLEIDLEGVDAVVLSHGHYDHLGGWTSLPESVKKAPVFHHPAALAAKYQRKGGRNMEPVNYPVVLEAIEADATTRVPTTEPTEVAAGVWVTGEIPRETDFEDAGGDFYLDRQGTKEDPLADDQAVFFRTAAGLVVILGCAHAGVVNTLNHVRNLCPDLPFHAVVGGMHLLNASQDRLDRTLEELQALAPAWLGPNHCTGDAAAAAIGAAFPGRILSCHAGQTVGFPVPRKHGPAVR